MMDRFWLLTSTFYGNWLPGDRRGFVARVREQRDGEDIPSRHEHDLPGTAYDADMPGLHRAAQDQMNGPPVRLVVEQAIVLAHQFRETASFRKWRILALAIMTDHIHLVVAVPGDPDPTKVLGDFKSYGSRALTREWGQPLSKTWWTYGGSKRKLPDERAVRAAIEYVRRQHAPLVVWIDEEYAPASGVA